MEGEVRTECLNWLVENRIKEEANSNIGNSATGHVSAHTSCSSVIQYIACCFDDCIFISFQPPLTNIRHRGTSNSQDGRATRRPESNAPAVPASCLGKRQRVSHNVTRRAGRRTPQTWTRGEATEPRRQSSPENQPSQLGCDAQRSPRENDAILPNTARPPAATSSDLDPNFTINPTSLDKSAPYQSPQRTIIRTNTNTNHEYDPFVGANPSSSPMPRGHDPSFPEPNAISPQQRNSQPFGDLDFGSFPPFGDLDFGLYNSV
ncbi:hypothetical protein LOZ58_006386 [Ophidiomyces ophidiicola]|nr:hypothetical protein LOZ58_006386 [Ophidiomyces ophidiicola]